MQFVSFRKREVDDVGITALDIRLPFDQRAILEESLQYIQSQLNIESINIIKLKSDGTTATVVGDATIPDRIIENVEPGKPYLWIRWRRWMTTNVRIVFVHRKKCCQPKTKTISSS